MTPSSDDAAHKFDVDPSTEPTTASPAGAFDIGTQSRTLNDHRCNEGAVLEYDGATKTESPTVVTGPAALNDGDDTPEATKLLVYHTTLESLRTTAVKSSVAFSTTAAGWM